MTQALTDKEFSHMVLLQTKRAAAYVGGPITYDVSITSEPDTLAVEIESGPRHSRLEITKQDCRVLGERGLYSHLIDCCRATKGEPSDKVKAQVTQELVEAINELTQLLKAFTKRLEELDDEPG